MTAVRGLVASDSLRPVVTTGLVGGIVALYFSLVGIVPVFDDRPLITGVLSLGQATLLVTALATGYLAGRRAPSTIRQVVGAGALAGAVTGGVLSLLLLGGAVVNIREVFLHASAELYGILTFGIGLPGLWVPIAAGSVLGAAGGSAVLVRPSIGRPLAWGLLVLALMGLFSGLLRTPMLTTPLADLARFLFSSQGLTTVGAAMTFAAAVAWNYGWLRIRVRERVAALPPNRRRAVLPTISAGVLLIVLALPHGLGPFVAQVVAVVAIYVLMGFGLNITLGLAGLLDLGFVAFFAVGAYTVGLLTSTAEFGLAQWPFWATIPIAVVLAMAFGAFLGLPILGIRGDYLAIATLGFGEIVRILAGSDVLKPLLGGPRGILNIPKPIDVTPDNPFAGPVQIYYIALACAAVIAFVALRLRDSRLGRAWVAIREDEDVAEALGISLVQTKLLAYSLGAGFAGLGGAVFAALVGSIFPSSINIFVSINVASLIIIGGMGSFPGVVLGAIFLIGIPELFRELSEYRFLFYGIALIAMMIARPEGLLPSRIARRELHVAGDAAPTDPSAVPVTER